MLEEIYQFFKEKAGPDYKYDFYIAGGSVMNTLVGRTPKDWDIFIFCNVVENYDGMILLDSSDIKQTKPNKETSKLVIKTILNIEFEDDYKKLIGNDSDFILYDYEYKDEPLQVIYRHRNSIYDLLNDFDWNICRFAYGKIPGTDKVGFIKEMDESEIVCHGDLKLHNPKNPLLSLERGFKFAQRYKMKIQEKDLRKLAHLINIEEQNKDYSI